MERSNVREVLEGGGVRVLTDLMSLAHLHVKRATLTTATNVIEGGPNMHGAGHKEWYYQVCAAAASFTIRCVLLLLLVVLSGVCCCC